MKNKNKQTKFPVVRISIKYSLCDRTFGSLLGTNTILSSMTCLGAPMNSTDITLRIHERLLGFDSWTTSGADKENHAKG